MAKFDLIQANSKLRSREKRTHQDVPRLTGIADLKRATVKLAKTAKALQGQLDELKASNKLAVPAKKAPPAPAKKALEARTVVIDGKTVRLGPGEEFRSLVVPKPKKI